MLSHLTPVILLFGLYFGAVWIAIAYWALKDARERTLSQNFQLFAMVVNLVVPVMGLLIYLLLRPGQTLADRRAQQLEEEVLSAGDDKVVRPCPACGREIESDFVLCPYCQTHFARRCPSCARSVRMGWNVCPYCAARLDVSAVPRVAGQG